VIDIRSEIEFEYGHMDNAVNIPETEIMNRIDELPKDKKLVICCKKGLISENIAEELSQSGLDAVSLEEGYYGWLRLKMNREDKTERVENSIHTEFEKTIWERFLKAVEDYKLVEKGDRIAVCISGGKDSMLMAKLFGELKKTGAIDFEVRYLVMDPGYSPANREIIEENARMMSVTVTIFESDIFDSVYNVNRNPCYLCARMRRGHLYKNAQSLGCNKIALGHHYDDVIETNLMGMVYGGQIQTMMPKLHSTNFEGMELIRPLYIIREDEIKRWRDYNGLHFIQCACKFTDTCTTCEPKESMSKRLEIKFLIREMAEKNPEIEENIFHSLENVNLDRVMQVKNYRC
jgi:tRNA(Ile)-lysidine synthase TilS/MesJ/rhodanese-related sulfurtransferase